jgi:ABC-type multidrug transport system fused ATPase/permease subunit
VRDESGIMKIEAGAIEFNKVNFIYPSRTKRVLKEFNMSIPANKKIALVGYSGCGKSTIANLLLRFYDINEGSILIDGKDIRQYNVAELRRQIGIVMQEPILFNVSIKENILYGNEKASDQRVWQVADMANALQFIESNIEDLDNENVQAEINKKYYQKVSDYSAQYPNMRKLTQLGEDNTISIKEKDVIYDILRKSDSKLRDNINTHIQRFVE